MEFDDDQIITQFSEYIYILANYFKLKGNYIIDRPSQYLLSIKSDKNELINKIKEVQDQFDRNVNKAFNTDIKIYYEPDSINLLLINSGKINRKVLEVKKEDLNDIRGNRISTIRTSCEFKLYDLADFYGKVFSKNISLSELYYTVVNINRNVNPSLIKDVNYLCEQYYKYYPPKEWLQSQIEYNKNLSKIDSLVVSSYTYKGDRFINSFLRNKMVIDDKIIKIFEHAMQDITNEWTYYKLMNKYAYIHKDRKGNIVELDDFDDTVEVNFNDDDIRNYGYLFYEQLMKVISNSPTEAKFKVYRGITEKITVARNDIFSSDSFLSSTLDIGKAFEYATENRKRGTVMEFTIKGKCLLIFKGKYIHDFEVLLPHHELWKVKSFNENAEYLEDNSILNPSSNIIKYDHISYY